ncbi:MAG: tetratricopeptide repeat protein [Verrucomicrobia bacterium]|nr:tetratricopeptide repeat protein [Verrucomicrobiota bacterium]
MSLKLSIILLLLSFNLFAQVNKKKLVVAQEIFDNLVNAYASNKSAPSLKILPKGSPKVVAQYIASPSPAVQVDEALFDICMGLGKDSANAFAIILSHELAHYYNDHNWCSDYAFALRNSALGNTLNKVSKESKIEKESIADSYGLFYSSLAGYKPFDVFNLLLDKIYKQYKLPEVVSGYPSKKERKEINRVQKEKIQNLIPVFEAGVILQYLKYYEEAASCFEYLTKFFPSREMYNNYGVSKISQALNYKTPEAVSFIYPIEIDVASRIYSHTKRGDDTINRENRFRELVQDAKVAFEKAISLDPKYVKSHINLACLYDIRGNYQAALGVVNEVGNLDISPNNDLQLIEAIALFHTKNTNEAKTILQKIGASGNALYEYNSKLLSTAILTGNDVQAIEKWKDDWVRERVIANTDTCNNKNKLLGSAIKAANISQQQNINDFLSVGSSVVDGNPILIIKMKNVQIAAEINVQNSISNAQTLLQNFTTSNGKCFSIQFPNFYRFVVYKSINEKM